MKYSYKDSKTVEGIKKECYKKKSIKYENYKNTLFHNKQLYLLRVSM